MVVVFGAKTPAYWASFATTRRPERKLSGSLAESTGFEPEVAVLSGYRMACWGGSSQWNDLRLDLRHEATEAIAAVPATGRQMQRNWSML